MDEQSARPSMDITEIVVELVAEKMYDASVHMQIQDGANLGRTMSWKRAVAVYQPGTPYYPHVQSVRASARVAVEAVVELMDRGVLTPR